MRTIISGLCAAAVALSTLVSPLASASAAPLPTPRFETPGTDAINVQSRRDRFERRGDRAYYNGHRGYRSKRPGYRRHNGFWFPATAFIAGAVIGGAIANQPRGVNRHVAWCSERYRSYRAYDNTYQPNQGGRRVCVSPYS